ncbi:MAG: hypothetical protein UX19_C0009G0005 [Candidatus Woesebacteria bacterium GW2011_GWA1_45_8]|uniref:Uncharacterized protein n=1 Tax=Candidatus Woesebacteria bacterium GW2011_GWA1_45_8 TaxID=1618559 RepID=A0A0G1QTS4_9BACT|nr:MAG: hypothetical protein UX19_C0009G0005 [Candidatus Woesebacteria bacterium GW2011_GWA1_45_8]
MKLGALFVATLLVVIGAVAARLNGQEPMGETLSSEVEQEESPSETPTQIPTPSDTATPTSQPTILAPSGNISTFIYPGARVITTTSTSATLESGENPDKITDWYKDKIVGLGMNVKSFVTTKANDRVLNKLAGTDGKREINVEISKDEGSILVIVSIKLANF